MSLPAGIDNVVSPFPGGAKSCGYCGPPGQRSEAETSYDSATLQAYFLTCSVYQDMIDRGWRRSGQYCYKPDLRISCCPQYTIRLDATQFKPTRSQRQILNRWNQHILYGDSDITSMEDGQSKSSRKGHKSPPFTTLPNAIHSAESGFHGEDRPAHTFTVLIEPASFTTEKFDLFKRYQADIHLDKKSSPSGFKRFLVDSPLNAGPIVYSSERASHLPDNYGSYHQLYRVDGQLIAMGVIDILPKCVSSVYFMYDKKWEKYSMGKISALREISLVQEMQEAGASEMHYLYMGFYIHSCQKMRYKGEYAPSYLADPETYVWYPLESCKAALETNRYACFSDPSHSLKNGEDAGSSQSPSFRAESPEFDDINILVRTRGGELGSVLVKETRCLAMPDLRDELGNCIRGLGHELARKIVFNL